MSETPSRSAEGMHDGTVSLRDGVYRYFFFGWLFRDADSGSDIERAIALRHNRDQAKWLPVYMRRWAVSGSVILALETLSELAVSKPVLSAALAVALIFVYLFLFVTVICWAFLLGGRRSGKPRLKLERFRPKTHPQGTGHVIHLVHQSFRHECRADSAFRFRVQHRQPRN